MKNDSKPKAHARYAASSSDRWLACPASIQLSDGAPDQEETAAAEEGTRAHDLMDFALSADVKNVLKSTMLDNDADWEKYPEDMRKHVQGFIDFVRSQMKPNYELLVEQRVHLDGVITDGEVCDCVNPDECLCIKLAFGTVDVAIIEPFGCLHIIDFKYGTMHVDEEDNSQMMYYALGLAHKLGYDIDRVKTTIYQPRSRKKSKAARTYECDPSELLKWKQKFYDGIKAAEVKKPKFNSGDHCFFCPAKIKCPAIYKKSLEKAGLDFADPVQPDPKHLTSDQLREVLEAATYLKLWIKEVETYAFNRLSKGEKVSGFTLVPKNGQRKWVDEKKVLEWDFEHFTGINQYLKHEVLRSPAEVEKILKAKKVSQETIDLFFKDNVHSVSSGSKLSSTTKDYDDQGLDDLIID